MFDYSVEQKTYEISGVKIGGQPGLVPTCMVGSMFYNGDPLVENHEKGIFDRDLAESQLKRAEEMSDQTGLPTIVDLVAENSIAVSRYIDFMVDSTDIPIFLDVVSDSAQAEALQYASEKGVLDGVIVNSLTPHTGNIVYEKIREIGCRNAVLLLHSTKHLLSSNKDEILEELVSKSKSYGIEKFLIDTVVLDIPTLGLAIKAINRVKDKYGYPSGCGAHNAVASWKRLREKYVSRAVTTAIGVTNALPIAGGADFIFFGPMRNASSVYPSMAMIDAAYSQQVMEKGIRLSKDHPRYKIG
jgi:tetrahydromethanopterin S-methyltransferase subunit H